MSGNYFVGEIIARFYYGEVFRLKYVGGGEFEIVGDNKIIPDCIRREFLL